MDAQFEEFTLLDPYQRQNETATQSFDTKEVEAGSTQIIYKVNPSGPQYDINAPIQTVIFSNRTSTIKTNELRPRKIVPRKLNLN